MSTNNLNISNPFSTGGGGVTFERLIVASYMVQLLSGDIPRGLDGRIASIRLQSKEQGVPLDDLLVITEDGRHLQVQAKHGLTFSENSELLKEVLSECWEAFTSKFGYPFNDEVDRIGIAIDGLTQDARHHLLPIIDWATSSISANEFWLKVRAYQAKLRYADIFSKMLSDAKGGPVTDGEMWRFFHSLRIMDFDFLHGGSQAVNDVWNKLMNLTPAQTPAQALSIFDALLAEADRLAPQAGTIDRSGLYFRIRLRHPDLWPEFIDDNGLAEDLARIELVYVPPAEYETAYRSLKRHDMVIISGPPHSGKSATGLHLAKELKSEDQNRPIIRIRAGDDLDTARVRTGTVLVLDDYYGDLQLNNAVRAGRFADLERLSRRCSVIITTRSEVLSQARRSTRLGEERGLDQYIVTLSQEGSYDDASLSLILKRHLDYMSSTEVPEGRRLSTEIVNFVWEARYEIISELRFPHNIERLCWSHLPGIVSKDQLSNVISAAKHIEEATRNWARLQGEEMLWFVFLLALFPSVASHVVDTIYRKVAQHMGFALQDVSEMIVRSSGYVTDSRRLRLSHPSYRNALLILMREEFEHRVAEIVDIGLMEVTRSDTFQLAQCDAADFGWVRYTLGTYVLAGTYLEPLAEAYNIIRDNIFEETKSCLAPYSDNKGVCLFLLNVDGSGGSMCIVPSSNKQVSVFIEQPINLQVRIDQLCNQAWHAGTHLTLYYISAEDFIKRSPQTHALDLVKAQMKIAFEKQRLQEPWQIAHLRMEKALTHPMWKLIGIDTNINTPWTDDKFMSLMQQLQRSERNLVLPPTGISTNYWMHLRQEFGFQPFTVSKCYETLKKVGVTFDGALFPSPDRKDDHSGKTIYSWYSPEQAERLIRCSLRHFIDSYRYMLQLNFGSLIHRMGRRARDGFKVIATYQYYDDVWGLHADTFIVPSNFPTVDNQETEVYIFATNDVVEPEIPETVKHRMQEIYQSGEALVHSWGRFDYLFDAKDFVKEIYKWLAEDLEYAIGWGEIGQERSNYLARRSQQFSEHNSNVAMVFDMTTNSDHFDWPSL